MEYNAGSNFKPAERVASGWLEIKSTVTPELYSLLTIQYTLQYLYYLIKKMNARNSEIKDLI